MAILHAIIASFLYVQVTILVFIWRLFLHYGKYKTLGFIPHVRCRKFPTSSPEFVQRVKVGENGT